MAQSALGTTHAARLTVRPQPTYPQLTGERRIRLIEPERAKLIEQHLRSHVRVLEQTRPAVIDERSEPVLDGRSADTSDTLVVQGRYVETRRPPGL